MDIAGMRKKANRMRWCLAHRRTDNGHRRYEEDEDLLQMHDDFASDEAKLLSSKAWRALRDKTQVFTFPDTLTRSRQAHVSEVVATSVVAADLMGLNTNLVRAAALGHDIGHVPFGHQGESWMKKAMGRPEFCHEVMGPIIAQKIERRGKGLNLTWHTLDAMMRHSGNTASDSMSQEAWVLRYADKMTYLFHDWNDIVGRAKYPVSDELRSLVNEFGCTQRERTTTAVAGMIIESAEKGRVSFKDSEAGQKFDRLRGLMYEIYPRVTQQNVSDALGKVLEFLEMIKVGDPWLLMALMTDDDVRCIANETMKDMRKFNCTAVSEIVPHLDAIGKIDLCDPGLNW